jgi:hypothetical protein
MRERENITERAIEATGDSAHGFYAQLIARKFEEIPNLSTHVETAHNLKQDASRKTICSLQALVQELDSQSTTPDLEQIYDWLENAQIAPNELLPYLGFKEGNYSRHRVCRNEFVEMLVLCWRPGHRTPIHDHNGSHGGVKIYKGLLWETTFSFDVEKGLSYKTGREIGAGAIT